MRKPSFYVQATFIAFSLLLIGCGGSEVLMRPDYSNVVIKSNRIPDSKVRVAKVIDRRDADSTTVGTGRVGMFEKQVPYRLSVPLSEFVHGVLDSLLTPYSPANTVPAIVFIDSFEVGTSESIFTESGRVDVKMDFGVPVTPDSVLYITTRASEFAESFSNVTPLLEPLIYKGVVDCGTQFLQALRKLNLNFSAVHADSIPPVLMATRGSVSSRSIEGVGQAPQPQFYHDVGVEFSAGGKVTSEFRLYGDILTQKDSSRSMTGFGLDLNVLSVTNKNAGIKGTLVTYGGNLTLRQFLSGSETSPYLGLQGSLIFGTETINYVDHQESSFFFGPILRETLGISFSKKVYAEAGAYQIVFIDSKMLPSDFGFTCGVSFGV